VTPVVDWLGDGGARRASPRALSPSSRGVSRRGSSPLRFSHRAFSHIAAAPADQEHVREAIVLRAACPTDPSAVPVDAAGSESASPASAGRHWVGAIFAALFVLLAVTLITGVVA